MFAGSAVLVVYVNQPPSGGTCSLSPPIDGSLDSITALVDGVTVICTGWTDPEDQGIVSYTINSKYLVSGENLLWHRNCGQTLPNIVYAKILQHLQASEMYIPLTTKRGLPFS